MSLSLNPQLVGAIAYICALEFLRKRGKGKHMQQCRFCEGRVKHDLPFPVLREAQKWKSPQGGNELVFRRIFAKGPEEP